MRRRCAIYTRKSTEEGLDQDFNSLDAQRAACEAYILSQKAEGWIGLPDPYDDGGVSGGTLDRPALQCLMTDIRDGKVDTVVVYKVDRLTRALSDFAKIVEVFDSHDVAFVSVTQQFNTTTSMGRLTLNMLLSFAQFEREVTAERIRDKIAASKKKGMWMGGTVPLGYDARDRKLVINETEAETVRTLFELYRDLGTVPRVKAEADRRGLRSKQRQPKSGNRPGGASFTPGHIHKILTNPVYRGEIVHKGTRYPGEHAAIISRELWDAVQAQLQQNGRARSSRMNARSPSLLAGLLKTADGLRFKPSHATKAGRRYRYYISQPEAGWRLPAREVESAVITGICELLIDKRRISNDLLSDLDARHMEAVFERAAKLARTINGTAMQHEIVRDILAQVTVSESQLGIVLRSREIFGRLGLDPSPSASAEITIKLPMSLRRRGVETRLVLHAGDRASDPDPRLVALVRQAHQWFADLRDGAAASVTELARQHDVDQGDVSRILPLTFLAPDITLAILEGRQPPELTAARLKRMRNLPLNWAGQRRYLGFS